MMDNKIKVFFDKHISSLHRDGGTKEPGYLDLEFDKAADSYFSAPQHPDYLYLNNIALENKKSLEDYLGEFWKDEPALLKLIPDLVSLAFILKDGHKEQSAELSPFVYAMF
jgi:hypothetical protein